MQPKKGTHTHTHNTFSIHFILFAYVFFWVKHFRQENRSNFAKIFSKRIPASASHLRQSFEMEVRIGLERENVISILNVLYFHSQKYIKLGYIKIRKRGKSSKLYLIVDKNMIVWYGRATSYEVKGRLVWYKAHLPPTQDGKGK